jgi:hypothetical protein
MRELPAAVNGGETPVTRPYTSNTLGVIQSLLAGLGGYDVMALELIQNADDSGAAEIVFDVREDALHIWNSGQFSSCENLPLEVCPWLDTGSPSGDMYACDFHRIMDIASDGTLSPVPHVRASAGGTRRHPILEA